MTLMRFIDIVKEEKNGFSFDEPWQLSEESLTVVIPIINNNETHERKYLTFSEARKIKVEDTGQIDYVYIKNEEDVAVLIARGEIFKGKTQERAAVHDYLIPANSSLRVSVRCIHASRGIVSGTNMGYGGKVAYSIDLSNQKNAWETISTHNVGCLNNFSNTIPGTVLSNTGNTYCLGDVHTYRGVRVLTGSFESGIDDFVKTIENMQKSMKEIMQKIPFIDNQVGAILFEKNDLIGMDVYDVPESWEAVKNDIIEKEGSSFLKKNDSDLFGFSLKPEKVKKSINANLNEEWEEKIIFDGDYQVVRLKSKNYLAEGLIMDEKVLHFSLWRT